jgi:hypothetical protein
MVREAWPTDELLEAAVQRYTSAIPGLVMPVAYGVGRLDDEAIAFGHVNRLGAVRPLPGSDGEVDHAETVALIGVSATVSA